MITWGCVATRKKSTARIANGLNKDRQVATRRSAWRKPSTELGEPMAKIPEMTKPIEICFKDAIDNLMFLKRFQLTVTNYIILLYVGVFSVNLASNAAAKNTLTVLTWCAFAYGTYLLVRLQIGMTRFRGRLTYIYRTYFSEAERKGLRLRAQNKKFLHQPWLPIGLQLISLIGALAVTYLLWRDFVPAYIRIS
jgi:hypothetical protein